MTALTQRSRMNSLLHSYLLFAILIAAMVLFILNRWRYDVVAALALGAALTVGVVPFKEAFSGFSNPAVITVACVMVLTQAIMHTGIIDVLIKKMAPVTKHITLHIAALSLLAAGLSAFMNNVGALAVLMPIAIQTANKAKRSPSLILMPVAFGSILGGMTTVIGTPSNLLISNFRQHASGVSFDMFDFTPVGVVVAIVGLVFLIFLGWRLLIERRKPAVGSGTLFEVEDYISEIKVPTGADVIGKDIKALEQLSKGDFLIVGMIRKGKKRLVVPPHEVLQANDILIVQASHKDLHELVISANLEMVEGEISIETLHADDIILVEAIVPSGSKIEGRSSQESRLRSRHQINLLAISREGKPFKNRLRHVRLTAGDVVLLQGDREGLHETISGLGFLALEERAVHPVIPAKVYWLVGSFGGAVVAAALRWLPIQIAFAMAILICVLAKVLPVRRLYDTIDWSVIVLLAAMIPLGYALQTTGATKLIAGLFVALSPHVSLMVMLGLLMLITMTLSDAINNAATTIVMAPIAISLANALHYSIDPFLMAVAVGASCSFLTPIGHQNNTLVMGPGGYKFFDYTRMGLPLELIVLATALPMIMWVWPVN